MVELPKLSPTEIAVGAAAIGGVAALGATAVILHRRKKNRKRKSNKNKSSRKRNYKRRGKKLKFGSKAYRKKYLGHGRRTPHTAGKRRDTSHRRIRYTSKGQPYIITSKGRARFISKKSVSSSYKRKGGKY